MSDDVARSVMPMFHRYWLEEIDRPECALRRAILEYRASQGYVICDF